MSYKRDLEERLLKFAVDTIIFLKTLPYKIEYNVLRNQLSKSATSVGANYQESQAGTSREFKQRIQICLREAKESNYWYKIISSLQIGEPKERKRLLQESKEIMLIFGSIATKNYEKEKNA